MKHVITQALQCKFRTDPTATCFKRRCIRCGKRAEHYSGGKANLCDRCKSLKGWCTDAR